MLKDLKLELKLLIFSFIVPVAIQLALFGYQVSNEIISIWNGVATLLVVLIFCGGVKKSVSAIKRAQELSLDAETADGLNTKNKSSNKLGVKARIVFFIIALVLAGGSVLCFNFYNQKSKGLDAVDATVVWQKGETKVDVKYEDGEEVRTETRVLNVTVLYEYNGVFKTANLEGTTVTELNVTKIKIYVDENGKAVCDCGRIDAFKYEAIVLLCFAALMLLVAILGLSIEFSAGGIMMFIGVALAVLVGCQFIENILYNDLVCFMFAFINMGLALIIYGVLSKIFKKPALENAAQNVNYEKEAEEVSFINNKRVCSYCGNILKEDENQCEACGASASIINREF